MSEQLTDDMALIEEWKAKFQTSMDENVSLKLEGNPELDLNRLRENYMLEKLATICLLYTSPSPRDQRGSRMPSSA